MLALSVTKATQGCGEFCLKQAISCWKLARLNIDPQHRRMFIRMAADWKQLAKRCGGRRDLCVEDVGLAR